MRSSSDHNQPAYGAEPTPKAAPLRFGTTAVQVHEYTDYRAFLKDAIDERKRNTRSFTYRRFAQKAGIRSHVHITRVLSGVRNLTLTTARGFAAALGLNQQDTTFFVNLVGLNQARTDDERAHFFSELGRHRKYQHATRMQRAAYDCYANWTCIAIRELAALPHFQPDPQWIARTLRPTITPKQAAASLQQLLSVGLLVRQIDGSVVQADPTVAAHGPGLPLAVRRFHEQTLDLAEEALGSVPIDQRHVAGVTLRLSAQQYAVVVERLKEMAAEVLGMETDAEGQAPWDVFHFGVQLFPMSQIKTSEPDPTDEPSEPNEAGGQGDTP